MKLFIERENKENDIKIDKPLTIQEILKQKNISLESVILIKNDKIVFENEIVKDNDNVKILSVVSGG
ncbi:MAG: MoaD/ThiS family protein [Nanoarchaeota archaeon]